MAFGFYLDPALTTLFTGKLAFAQDVDAPAPADRVLYLGNPAAGKTLYAASNPGVDSILVSIVDAATGSGLPASAVKLASTAGGLAGATAGAALNLGTSIAGGAAGARAVHVRVSYTAAQGSFADLSLQTNQVIG